MTERITILTGAGVSTSAGIPDFQSMNDEWAFKEDRFSILSLPFFLQEPEYFWNVYHTLFDMEVPLIPADFHRWCVELEKKNNVGIVTQNVDGLHQLAGSSTVFEVHGNRSKMMCISEECDSFTVKRDRTKTDAYVPLCTTCDSPMKPDTVLFFEGVYCGWESRELATETDVLVVAGTSLNVGPINELPLLARMVERVPRMVWINREPPPKGMGYHFDEVYLMDTDEFAALDKVGFLES